MFSVLNEIRDNSSIATTSVVLASIGTACSTYILVAITGYLSFGNGVADNVVSMYPTGIPSTIAKAAIAIMVMLSYPLQVHPCRASIDAVMKWRPASRLTEQTHTGSSSGSTAVNSPSRSPLLRTGKVNAARTDGMSDTRFALITTVVICLSYVVAISVSSLSTVLAYVGSTGSTSISFILPGLFYYKISDPESAHHQRLMKEDDDGGEFGGAEVGEADDERDDAGLLSGAGKSTGWQVGAPTWKKALLRRMSLGLAIYGGVVMVVCLIVTTVFHAGH